MSEPAPVELMAAIAERDREAFAALFRMYGPKLKAYLLRGGLPSERADEVLQDVMLTVWRKADTYDPRKAAVSTWLFTIARNRRIDALRRERRPELDPDDPALVPAPPAAADQLVHAAQRGAAVRAALAELPEDQAAVLRGAYFEDRTMRGIAEAQGLAVGTVKSRVRLAMSRLRVAFGVEAT